MPKTVDGNASRKIEVLAVIKIPEVASLSTMKDWWLTVVCADHELRMFLHEPSRLRVLRRVRIWQSAVSLANSKTPQETPRILRL